jgi:hypothetical protein
MFRKFRKEKVFINQPEGSLAIALPFDTGENYTEERLRKEINRFGCITEFVTLDDLYLNYYPCNWD